MRDAGLFEYFNKSTIVNVTNRPLNGQRALVLTGEVATNMRKELAETRKVKQKAAAAAAEKAGLLAAAKGVLAEKLVESVVGPPPHNIVMCSRGSCPMPRGVPGAGWTGCPAPVGDGVLCTVWHCNSSKACTKEHTGHVSKHLAILAAQQRG